MSDAAERARSWMNAEAPVLWLLGKAQAGKTSIVAEMTGQGHDDVGRGYRPMTQASRIYGFPPERPALRFLDTRGLADCADNDPSNELGQAQEQANLLLVVLRVEDQDVQEIIDTVNAARRRQRQLPVIVAQTGLHRCYDPHQAHLIPYPFDGSDDDAQRPDVPYQLGQLIMLQRRRFDRLPGKAPLFVPLDFTRPEQGIAPTDYGADRLWDLLEQSLPEVSERLRRSAVVPNAIRSKVMLPWAVAAAAANAIPVPVIGGLGAANLQAAMVSQIAQRLGFPPSKDLWLEFVGTLGTGFAFGFGGSWAAQQALKMGLGWGTAIVASWTFAITWAIGEAALYYFGEKAAGRKPEREQLTARYHQALREARARYETLKQERKEQS